MTQHGTLAFAMDKAKTWANSMGRPFFVVEYRRGRYDAVGDAAGRKIHMTIQPEATA